MAIADVPVRWRPGAGWRFEASTAHQTVGTPPRHKDTKRDIKQKDINGTGVQPSVGQLPKPRPPLARYKPLLGQPGNCSRKALCVLVSWWSVNSTWLLKLFTLFSQFTHLIVCKMPTYKADAHTRSPSATDRLPQLAAMQIPKSPHRGSNPLNALRLRQLPPGQTLEGFQIFLPGFFDHVIRKGRRRAVLVPGSRR